MAGIRALRGEIAVALSNPNFVAVAARLSGGFLRQVVVHRFAECQIDVVVIAANALDENPPYKRAEVVWQLPDGGEFVRQTVRWDLAPWATSADAHVPLLCDVCGQDNDVPLDGSELVSLRCSRCGALLPTTGAASSAHRSADGLRKSARSFPRDSQ
jgi:hypothetical protein